MTCHIGSLVIFITRAPPSARGNDYEFRAINNVLLRLFVRMHRRFIWLREPLNQNHLLDRFLSEAGAFDHLIANGDYSCNTAFVGMSDDAACQSARECLEKLRQKFGAGCARISETMNWAKVSFFGGQGGMRLASWQLARDQLGLERFWELEIGRYVLMGIVSSLIALPVFEPDTLPEERAEWERLRTEHLAEVREAFARLDSGRRVILFCHDPTALPFCGERKGPRKLSQIEQTIIRASTLATHLNGKAAFSQGCRESDSSATLPDV